jgi:hypothetical protein
VLVRSKVVAKLARVGAVAEVRVCGGYVILGMVVIVSRGPVPTPHRVAPTFRPQLCYVPRDAED